MKLFNIQNWFHLESICKLIDMHLAYAWPRDHPNTTKQEKTLKSLVRKHDALRYYSDYD